MLIVLAPEQVEIALEMILPSDRYVGAFYLDRKRPCPIVQCCLTAGVVVESQLLRWLHHCRQRIMRLIRVDALLQVVDVLNQAMSGCERRRHSLLFTIVSKLLRVLHILIL